MTENNRALYDQRLDRINRAIRLEKTDRVPIAPFFSSWIQRSHGSSYRDIYYDHDKAGQAAVDFYKAHPMMDVCYNTQYISGLANELAQTQIIDWPGRPGTKVSDYSSHQVIEHEFMTQEEYPELLRDFTGFMLRKYIPRAFKGLEGLSELKLTPTVVLNTGFLEPLYRPGMEKVWDVLGKIGRAEAECAAIGGKYAAQLTELGFPSMFTGGSEAPFDILSDYFRGTMGTFEDLMDEEVLEYVERVCYMFADQQIENLQYFRHADMPVRRVFFPLHKAMDGFMSEKHFERIYWKPLKKIVMALIDMDVTPYLYTEGPYNTRLEMLTDVPKGKVLYHFETVDMARAKRILGGTACICGNLPVTLLEFGKKEDVADAAKRLLDTCMPDGGYIFDFDGSLENAKQENLDVMFEILDKYGKYD